MPGVGINTNNEACFIVIRTYLWNFINEKLVSLVCFPNNYTYKIVIKIEMMILFEWFITYKERDGSVVRCKALL